MVDVYDALTTDHPYKLALSPEDALGQIHAEAEMRWRDPELVAEFRRLILDGDCPPGERREGARPSSC